MILVTIIKDGAIIITFTVLCRGGHNILPGGTIYFG